MEEVTHKTIKNGGLLTKIYFDKQSEKSEDLQPLMAEFVQNEVLKMPGVIYCFGTISSPMKVEDMFSATMELTVLFKDLGALINFTFKYTPAVVEVIQPEREYVIKAPILQSVLMDIANVSEAFSKYNLKNLSPEAYEKYMDDVKRREALGKRLLEDKKGSA